MSTLFFSAENKTDLEASVQRYLHDKEYLTHNPTHPFRLASMPEELSQQWEKYEGKAAIQPITSLLFTGQGSQRSGMGQHSYQCHPVFKDTLDHIASYMNTWLDMPLHDLLFDAKYASLLNQTRYTQPALFAFEYALAKTVEHLGVKADFVLGHSVGEFSAASFAGFMSLEDGIELICQRGALMQALPEGGGMAAIACETSALESLPSSLAIAGLNSPKQTVISGDLSAINNYCDTLKTQGIRATPLTVSHAFHSPLMTPMLEAFAEVAKRVTYLQPRIPMLSNVTGELLSNPLNPDYWVEHVTAPVNFLGGMQTLSKTSCNTLMEIGPHPILTQLASKCLEKEQYQWISTGRKGRIDWNQWQCQAFNAGFPLS